MSTPVISARSWSKTFSGTRVLSDIALDIYPGEVHALLGQNGSGKSTFIKILSGFHAPDDGATLEVDGESVPMPLAPGDARRLNLAMVHQDLCLIDEASVLENLRIGRFGTGRSWAIRWRREREDAQRLLDHFGLGVTPDTPVSELREVERATLALIRALDELASGEGGLLVLDEPTAYLPRDGVGRLFRAVRDVAERGIGVLFVTHRLEEVREIADRVSVLRDGRLVASGHAAELDDSDLVRHIVGAELAQLYPDETPATAGEPAVIVEGLRSSLLDRVSFTIGRGEILGITGLIGMGWEELPHVLAGASPAFAGTLDVGGRREPLVGLSVRKARDLDLALLPANRGRDGIVADGTIVENATLATVRQHFRRGILSHGSERRRVCELIREFDIRPRDPDRTLGTLSGGNQQKVLIARWLEANTRVFLMHEPTQGVDVGARRQIFELIKHAAERGTSMLFASSEYEDLAHMCHRVLVFRNGRIASELSGSELSEERIAEQSFRRVAA